MPATKRRAWPNAQLRRQGAEIPQEAAICWGAGERRNFETGPRFSEGSLMKHAKVALEDLEPSMPGVQQVLPHPNPPYEGKGAFRKITMTLPQLACQQLIQESAR